MYPYSIYLGFQGVSITGTLRPRCILYSYMEPLGEEGTHGTLNGSIMERRAMAFHLECLHPPARGQRYYRAPATQNRGFAALELEVEIRRCKV